MPALPDEPSPIGGDYRHLREDELLRLFAHHREQGDDQRRRAVWEALVVKTFDRVVAAVKVFRFPGGKPLPLHQRDDATQEAYLRAQAMAGSFRGTTEAEYRVALAKCVWYACMDFGRRELRHDEQVAGSIDAPAFADEHGDRGRYDDAIESEARRRQEESLDRLAAEAALARERDLVAWAISQVENDGQRAVLEMTYLEGLDGAEIAARLEISMDNVYARRLRGKRRMEKILREGRP